MFIAKPLPSDYAEFYAGYISQVPEGDIISTLKANQQATKALLESLAEEKANFAYAPEKWTIKEVIGHIIDTERIFAYRFLRMYRGDATPLPSFEQDDYVKNANTHKRTLASLSQELYIVRESNLLMLSDLDESKLDFQGTMSGKKATPRALLYILAGHEAHHINILKERYL
ncbi:MAG: DinB family protein [Thermoflexibacter sp.]